jgi:hypothetical protein
MLGEMSPFGLSVALWVFLLDTYVEKKDARAHCELAIKLQFSDFQK